jgi:hypothetical protein
LSAVTLVQSGVQAAAAMPWKDLSYGGLFFLAVWLLLTGRIVTRAVIKDVERQRDTYKESWERSLAVIESLEARLNANTEALNTVERTMSAVLRKDA